MKCFSQVLQELPGFQTTLCSLWNQYLQVIQSCLVDELKLGNYGNLRMGEGSTPPKRSPANTTFSSPQGNLPISKEVNRKKSEAEGARLAPASGYGQHFTKINYLYSF